MACFGAFTRGDPSPGEIGLDDLAMIDKIEGFCIRLGDGQRHRR